MKLAHALGAETLAKLADLKANLVMPPDLEWLPGTTSNHIEDRPYNRRADLLECMAQDRRRTRSRRAITRDTVR